MKWLSRLRCELQDHIRVTEDEVRRGDYGRIERWSVTRCTRCGWTSRNRA